MLIDTFDQEPSIWSGIVISKHYIKRFLKGINNLIQKPKNSLQALQPIE